MSKKKLIFGAIAAVSFIGGVMVAKARKSKKQDSDMFDDNFDDFDKFEDEDLDDEDDYCTEGNCCCDYAEQVLREHENGTYRK